MTIHMTLSDCAEHTACCVYACVVDGQKSWSTHLATDDPDNTVESRLNASYDVTDLRDPANLPAELKWWNPATWRNT